MLRPDLPNHEIEHRRTRYAIPLPSTVVVPTKHPTFFGYHWVREVRPVFRSKIYLLFKELEQAGEDLESDNKFWSDAITYTVLGQIFLVGFILATKEMLNRVTNSAESSNTPTNITLAYLEDFVVLAAALIIAVFQRHQNNANTNRVYSQGSREKLRPFLDQQDFPIEDYRISIENGDPLRDEYRSPRSMEEGRGRDEGFYRRRP